jgi:hypothetical protein
MSLPLFSIVLAVTGVYAMWTERVPTKVANGLLNAAECVHTERLPNTFQREGIMEWLIASYWEWYAPWRINE